MNKQTYSIGSIYNGYMITEVRKTKTGTELFGVKGTVSPTVIKNLIAHFALPASKRGFMMRPGIKFATVN
jgi:hypothetical protein